MQAIDEKTRLLQSPVLKTNRMKRILVPTDFSPTSEKALRFAIDIASKAKGTVILYHAYMPAESTFVGTEKTRMQYNTQTETKLVNRLQRFKKKVVLNDTDIPVSTVLGRSPVIDNILEFAEQNQIDLLVMGTQGASGLKKTIIGSTAARIIEKSNIPVLLVPEKYQWKDIERIVLATNYQGADRKALTIILPLAKLYAAEVTIIHLYDFHAMDEKKEKTDFESYAYGVQRTFSELNLKFRLLKTSSITESMENLAEEIPCDIAVMVRRKKTFPERFFLKSFTKNMAYVTRLPLLIVPE